jgi:hypothetical protein
MLIGDTVIDDGQDTVVGFTPMSVTPAKVQLQPLEGGERFWIDQQLLGEPVAPGRAVLRLSPEREGREN